MSELTAHVSWAHVSSLGPRQPGPRLGPRLLPEGQMLSSTEAVTSQVPGLLPQVQA